MVAGIWSQNWRKEVLFIFCLWEEWKECNKSLWENNAGLDSWCYGQKLGVFPGAKSHTCPPKTPSNARTTFCGVSLLSLKVKKILLDGICWFQFCIFCNACNCCTLLTFKIFRLQVHNFVVLHLTITNPCVTF